MDVHLSSHCTIINFDSQGISKEQVSFFKYWILLGGNSKDEGSIKKKKKTLKNGWGRWRRYRFGKRCTDKFTWHNNVARGQLIANYLGILMALLVYIDVSMIFHCAHVLNKGSVNRNYNPYRRHYDRCRDSGHIDRVFYLPLQSKAWRRLFKGTCIRTPNEFCV